MTTKTITNNQFRPLLDWNEIPERIRTSEFDWIEESEAFGHSFFKYRGHYYCLSEFMSFDDPFWHGYNADTYFSATVVRIDDEDPDRILVGRIFS